VFQAEKDYGALAAAALPLLKPGGALLASTNAANFAPEDFIEAVTESIRRAGRSVSRRHYAPQPPDFPIEREEPAYLKTVWLSLE
jgi:23S rRNA (cytosine1962-C5)-methyltransferase